MPHTLRRCSLSPSRSFTQIVAVIICDTGIALLAYMDGANSRTLGCVVLAAAAATGDAVYKVSESYR